MRRLRQDLHALRPVLVMLGLPRRLVARAILLGTLTLGASVALAGTSAWLIVRAAQMPPVMYLNVAAVGVRFFGILRGLARYTERLATHDLALGGVATLRTTMYERLAAGRTEALARLRRGDLLARTGADVDDVGDVVVRALVPAGVAVVTCTGSVLALALLWWPSAVVLAVCLAVSAAVVPLLATDADVRAEHARLAARTSVVEATESLVSRAAELALAGKRGRALADLERAHVQARSAERLAARPFAASAALAVAATGASALGSLLVAVPAAAAGQLSATALGVVVLLPLAAFEATMPLPSAASQLHRSAQAARRITALLGSAEDTPGDTPAGVPATAGTAGVLAAAPGLHARGLIAGWPGGPGLGAPLDLDVPPGTSVAIVGPSGVGKTTLLLTLAGMLPCRAGTVRLDGVDPASLRGSERSEHVALTAEDAHVFTTSVLENLRVARGDLTREEASELLAAVGLRAWAEALPAGLDTQVSAQSISGGERRRLLVARALASPAPLLLLDEPAEHLPDEIAQELVRDLLALGGEGRSVVVVTHHLKAVTSAEVVLTLEGAKMPA